MVGSDWWLSSAAWIAALLAESNAIGQRIDHFLFRSKARKGQLFQEVPMESNAINSRLKYHLETHGLYTGQSVHGSKRGRCQFEQAKGASMQDLLDLSLTNTASVMQRYLNKRAHEAPV